MTKNPKNHYKQKCTVTNHDFESSFEGECKNGQFVLYKSLIQDYPAATIALENASLQPFTFIIEMKDGGTITKTFEPRTIGALTVKNLKQIIGTCGSDQGFVGVRITGTVSFCLNGTPHVPEDHGKSECTLAQQKFFINTPFAYTIRECDNSQTVLYESLIHPYPEATIKLENPGQCPVTYIIEMEDGKTLTKTVPPAATISLMVKHLKKIVGQCGSSPGHLCILRASGTVSFCLNKI